MKTKRTFLTLITTICCSLCIQAFAQQSADSILLLNSEQWKVKQNKGMFGLARPQFGSYTTMDVEKADAPVIRKRTKDSSDFSGDISRDGIGLDGSKFLTKAKTKSYMLRLSTKVSSTEVVFSIASVSKEKKQTLLGKMFSKNEEEGSEVLSYNRDVAGTITNSTDENPWTFFIDNYTSGTRQTATQYYHHADILSAFLKNENDSLFAQMNSSIGADLVIVNNKGDHFAALKFKQAPAYVWIRNDVDKTYQQSIAAFFAVIIGIRDL